MNCGIDGTPILFYARGSTPSDALRRPRKSKARTRKPDSPFAAVLEGVRAHSLTSATERQIAQTVRELFTTGKGFSGSELCVELTPNEYEELREYSRTQYGSPMAAAGVLDDAIDYSHVTYPQDLSNCRKCHNGGEDNPPADASNWKTRPTAKACDGCHDVFPDDHPAGNPTNNALCADGCHTPTNIEEVHKTINATPNNPDLPTGQRSITCWHYFVISVPHRSSICIKQ